MITKGNDTAGAIFSDCERYRYRLWRVWDDSKPRACFVMLNPSTADENQLDPTVTRCKKRAETLGYGALEIVNLFAIRSKDPSVLYDETDPVGHHNFQAIAAAVKISAIAICAWGSHGTHMNVGPFIRDRLMQFFPAKFHVLTLNEDDSPTHPLYLSYEIEPTLWSAVMDNTDKFRRECEAKHVLRIADDTKRETYLQKILEKRGKAAFDELLREIKIQEPAHLLKLDQQQRTEYYQKLLDKHGRAEVDELITNVKKQRRLTKSPELSL